MTETRYYRTSPDGGDATRLAEMADAQLAVPSRLADKKLDHVEAVAIGPDGRIYGGGEQGQIYAIGFDDIVEEVANTGGDVLGLAFDANGTLFACDRGRRELVRVDVAAGEVTTWSSGTADRPMWLPNSLWFDGSGRLLVSDSGWRDEPSGCIYAVDSTGATEVWWRGGWIANGLTVRPDGGAVVLVESFGERVIEVDILADGAAGESRVLVDLPGVVPDGVAYDVDGTLYIACYSPALILSFRDGVLEPFAFDPRGLTMCQPTNVAIHEERRVLVSANLGSRHLTTFRL